MPCIKHAGRVKTSLRALSAQGAMTQGHSDISSSKSVVRHCQCFLVHGLACTVHVCMRVRIEYPSGMLSVIHTKQDPPRCLQTAYIPGARSQPRLYERISATGVTAHEGLP